MTATRQDAWTADDDLLLAEVTLRCIREGSTQLAAFEEVGQRLGRTAAACGFRWNSAIRKKYEAAIQIAKSQRQQRKKIKPKTMESVTIAIEDPDFTRQDEKEVDVFTAQFPSTRNLDLEEELSFDVVIRFLRSQKDAHKRLKSFEKELADKTQEIELLKQENARMKAELSTIQNDYQVVNDDYKALIQIMDRARKMAFLVDQEEIDDKPRFKMDANGNLERVDNR
ncbi:RsfA family transcriptional regulator [Aneurinibacillus terranovensis]|uniref:RsfA family transcriptional regulator n=1 Tax=Aneurinibacillus terranovensis TaxID=278991 RepID=UPI0003F5D068|nr:RsfA family transcriptional regulator [Aneurinibacillus terranovensis]